MKSTEKIRVIKVINPFDRKSNVVEYKDFKPLTKIIDYIDDKPDEVVVALNGKVLSKDELNELMPLNGELIISPIVEGGGGGGKNILRAVASIAVMVAAIEVPIAIFGKTALTTLEGAALSAGIAIGGSLLVNVIFPAPKLDLPELGNINGLSKETYGWDGVKTTVKQGTPIPVLYGKRKVGGNLISIATLTSNRKQKQYLNMLLALTGHKISAITDIKINNQPIDMYRDVQYDIRLGTVSQTPISIIPESQVITTVGQTIKHSEAPVQVQTQGTEIEGIQVNFLFPYGIFYANNSGGFDSRTVELQIDIIDSNGNVVQSRDVKYSNAKAKPLRYSESFDNLSPDKYTVKVTRITKDNTNNRQQDEARLDSIAEIIYDKLAYPCTSLLGIKALATDQLSGTMPNVTCIVDRGNFASDDYGVHSNLYNRPSNNPAWTVADILTNESYGGNYELDWNAFQTWADFCNNNGYEINIYFDGEISVWDAALRIARESKGILKIEGTKVSVTIDEQADPVQLFTVANIVEGSFKEHFLPLQSRANCCEVTFCNEDHDYQREQFMVYLPEWNTENEIKSSITLYGITNYDSAIKHAQYMLNYNKYLTRSGEFDADIDAIACTVGDIVKLQFDVPNWGQGGRIVNADTSQIVLDQKIDFEDGKEYKIVYRLQDDTQIEKTWTQSGTTTTDTIQISLNNSEVPSKYDVYAIGEVGFAYKLVRITSIDRKDDLTRHISWIEYNPSIYTDMPEFPPQPDYDLGDLDAKNLTVSQATYPNPSGDISGFHLSWSPNANVLKWRVYYKLNVSGFGEEALGQSFAGSPNGLDGNWHFYKEVETNEVDVIFDNLYDVDYTFAVCGVGAGGSQNPDNAQQVSIVPTPMNHKVPFFPDGAKIHSQFDTKLHIWWDKAITSALNHYEVSYVENGVQKVVNVTDNQFTISNPVQRDYSFSIVAVDAWEQRSEPLTGSAENAPPSTPSMPTLEPYFSTIVVNWKPVSDNDVIGYNVYASKDPNNLKKVAFIQSTSYTLKCNSNETWYVAISAVDPFGEGNLSAQSSETSLSAQLTDYDLDIPLLKGISWSVSGGQVYWTAGNLNYKGNVYSISSGNSAYKYIWWDLSNPTKFQASNDRPAIGADTWLMAYFDGTNVYPATQNKIQHAGLLQADSITADLIGTNEIITNVANIKDGVVENAKIGGVIQSSAVDNKGNPKWKIDKDGTSEFHGTTIYDDNGNVIMTTDSVLWQKISGDGKPEDGADVTINHTAKTIKNQGALAIQDSADWHSQISNRPRIFRIVSRGFSSTTQPIEAGLYDENNNRIGGYDRSYIVDVYDRASGTWDSHKVYDVFGDASNARTMANDLNNLDASKIVIVRTLDEPQSNRLTNGLPDAIYRCGGSRTIFASSNFKARSAYILIGIPGIGEGNGIELYAGDVDSDSDAWVETTITITASGNIQLGNIKARDAVDISYSDGTSVENLKPAQANATVGAQANVNLKDKNSNLATDIIHPNNPITSDNIDIWIRDAAITNAKIDNLDAGKITTGTLSADRIASGSISADKLNVSTLDAISANLGTITAGKAQDSGGKFIIDFNNGYLEVIDGNGVVRVKLGVL